MLVIFLEHVAEIYFSIVHCSTIFMVDDLAGRCVHDLPVHEAPVLYVFVIIRAGCVPSAERLLGLPLVSIDPIEIVGIDNCSESLR